MLKIKLRYYIAVSSGSQKIENITQIMWPSHYVEGLMDGPIHQRLELLAKALLGQDMTFDFDMMISKVGVSLVKPTTSVCLA